MRAKTDDYGEPSAVEVGDDSSWNFEDKYGGFQDGSYQHQLKCIEADDLDLIHEIGGEGGGQGEPGDEGRDEIERVSGQTGHG